MLVSKLLYASRAIALIAAGILAVAVLGFLEEQRWITADAEGLIRLVLCSAVVGVLAVLTARAPIERRLKGVIITGCCIVVCEYVISFTEDIPRLADTPLFGRNSSVRRLMEPTLSGIWMLILVYVAYKSVRALRVLHSDALRQERLRAIGQMSSGIAHDLNNALTPLVGAAQLLASSVRDPTPEQDAQLRMLELSVEDVTGIVERISHLYAKQESTREVTNLRSLLEEVMEGMSPKWKVESELRRNRIDVFVDAYDVWSCVDPTEIRVVVTNLLLNSINALPEGGSVRLGAFKEGNAVVVEVADSGQGMDAAELQKCTEPFFTTHRGGSGLGLATCNQILEGYDTALNIQSELTVGTTIAFRLASSQSPDANAVGETNPRHSQRRVLIIEDNAFVRETVARMLRHAGASVEVACDGETGITMASQSSFDIIITDYGLPDLTGGDVVRRTRKVSPDSKIVLLSGWNPDLLDQQLAGDNRPDVVLRKPVQLSSLSELLAEP